MNSLASILYSSSSATSKNRKNRSLKPTASIHPNGSKCKVSGTFFRSSTPKIPLTTLAKPIGSSSSSSLCPTDSSESPRCSTPVFAKQRRTRPFIACELCRQRAFQTPNENDTKNEKAHVHHHHHRSTTLFYQPSQSTMKTQRRRSSIAQLLVWIV